MRAKLGLVPKLSFAISRGCRLTQTLRNGLRPLFVLAVLVAGLFFSAGAWAQPALPHAAVLAPRKAGLVSVPLPTLDSLETTVAEQVRAVQQSFAALAAKPNVSDSELADAYGLLGQLYHAYEFRDAALICYGNAARLAPLDYRWRHLLGELNQRIGRLEDSAEHYQAARRMNPRYPASAVRLGSVYLQLNRPGDAQRQFEAALRQDAESAAAHSGLGEAAAAQQRPAGAISHFQAALKRVPQANRIHYLLAMAYRAAGDLEQAKIHLERRGAVGVRPKDPLVDGLSGLIQGERVHLIRGRLAFAAGQFEQAAQAFAKAVEADSDSVRARVNFGVALDEIGQREKAAEQFEAALRLDSKNPAVHFNLGMILAQQGNHLAAIKHYGSIVEVSPKDLEANRELVRSLLKAGQREEAAQRFFVVLALAPGDEASLIQLADLMARGGRYKQSIELLSGAHEKFPEKLRAMHSLARLLAACPDPGLRDGARALQMAMKAYNTKGVVAHGETVALALLQLGRCEEAAQWQNRLVTAATRAKDSELAAQLKQQLNRYESGAPCAFPASAQD
jgi:tetratricopeptide (TPR) repeat protein